MFTYNLEQEVKIKCSSESGEIIARAEYSNSQDMYLIRYKCGDGRAVESWWGQDAISEV